MTSNALTANVNVPHTVQRVRYGRLWWVGLAAIVLSILANVAVRAIALSFITVPPEFPPLADVGATIGFTVMGLLAAIIAFAIVGRFSRRPARTYTIIAIVALLLSFIPNMAMLAPAAATTFPGATVGGVTILMIQHVVTAIIVVWLLTTQAVETVPAQG